MKKAKPFALLLLTTLLIIFTLQNYEVVEVNFLFWSVELSRALMLFGVLVTGFGLGWLANGLGGGSR